MFFKEGYADAMRPYVDVIADGSELGYLQWVLLYVTGEQFYLDWHANIRDVTFIVTSDVLDQLVVDLMSTDFGYPMNGEQAEKARAIDPTPKVSIDNETVTMRMV